MIDLYNARMSALGAHDGERRRNHAQKIMDASWVRDPATKKVYVKWVDQGLPKIDDIDIPVYAKFNVKSYHNITGDEVAYLLQFRIEDMKNNPDIKVGSYVQIVNEMDEPEWWLLWHLDDRTQFRQFSILKCTWIYKWVSFNDGARTVHQCLGVTRNQNNYNSGVWLDYTTQVVEQQHVMMMPSNKDTNTIAYDSKFLVSNEGRYPPIAWKISKIQPSVTNDTVRFTMTQEQFNASTDDAELMIANYKMSHVTPELSQHDETLPVSNYEIVCSGSSAVRAGGGYKKFTLKTLDGDNVIGDIEWSVDFPDGDLSSLECTAADNTFKVKCVNDYSLIGKAFTINAKINQSSTFITVEVISL